MWVEKPGGFALLEVIVALALLTVSTIAIAQALGAAVDYARAAEAARRATTAAAALAETVTGGAQYPAGWGGVGDPGADGLPGTRDDGPPAGTGYQCQRRVVTSGAAAGAWTWVEASCWPRLPGSGGALPPPGFVGGALARSVTLARAR